MEILEKADENFRFEKLLDLPAELRVVIYGFYFESLPQLDEPTQPPLAKVSRLIRQESLPIFFGTCTFILSNALLIGSFQNPILVSIDRRRRRVTKGDFFGAMDAGYLQTMRRVLVEHWDDKVLWKKGQIAPEIISWDDEPVDDLSECGRSLVRYLETVETRPEGNALRKADITKLRELMTH